MQKFLLMFCLNVIERSILPLNYTHIYLHIKSFIKIFFIYIYRYMFLFFKIFVVLNKFLKFSISEKFLFLYVVSHCDPMPC